MRLVTTLSDNVNTKLQRRFSLQASPREAFDFWKEKLSKSYRTVEVRSYSITACPIKSLAQINSLELCRSVLAGIRAALYDLD
jgi:hypothetical protein